MTEHDSVKDVLANVRRAAFEDCARLMDDQRIALEVAQINRAKGGGVAYDPEQTFWKKAASLLRAMPVSTPIPLTPSDEMVEIARAELRKWQNYDIEPDEMKAVLSAALNLMGGDK